MGRKPNEGDPFGAALILLSACPRDLGMRPGLVVDDDLDVLLHRRVAAVLLGGARRLSNVEVEHADLAVPFSDGRRGVTRTHEPAREVLMESCGTTAYVGGAGERPDDEQEWLR